MTREAEADGRLDRWPALGFAQTKTTLRSHFPERIQRALDGIQSRTRCARAQ
jgi:hypothetical protein